MRIGTSRSRSGFVLVGVVVLAALTSLLVTSYSAGAGAASMTIDPADTTVAAGGSKTVNLVAEPPNGTLAIWVVSVSYDPAVLSVNQCTSWETPAGVESGIAACDDTGTKVVALGGVIFAGSGDGLSVESVLASIRFNGEGDVGQCSALTVEVDFALDRNGDDIDLGVSNGNICIAPGEGRLWGDVDCDGGVDLGDAIKIGLDGIGSDVDQEEGCPGVTELVSVQFDSNDIEREWGDVDCDGGVDLGDAIKIGLSGIGSDVDQSPPCPEIESDVITN